MPTVCGWDPPDHSGKKSSDRLSPPESKTKIYFQSILTTETIYEIDITAQGKKATVFHASPWCPQIGFPWCGSGGCTSYVIVDGVSFETWGGRPVSVSVSDYRVVVIVPRSGGACVDANGSTLPNSASCSSVAVWDDQAKTFNSIPSVTPVFKVSDFMP